MDYEYLTTAEVAAIIRKSPDWVAKQCAKRDLRSKKLGNEWRVHRDDLSDYMRSGPPKAVSRRRPVK